MQKFHISQVELKDRLVPAACQQWDQTRLQLPASKIPIKVKCDFSKVKNGIAGRVVFPFF